MALNEEYETEEITLAASREMRQLKDILVALGRFQIQAGLVNIRSGSFGEYQQDHFSSDLEYFSFELAPEIRERIASASKKAFEVLGDQ
jgi:hypothetical protein